MHGAKEHELRALRALLDESMRYWNAGVDVGQVLAGPSPAIVLHDRDGVCLTITQKQNAGPLRWNIAQSPQAGDDAATDHGCTSILNVLRIVRQIFHVAPESALGLRVGAPSLPQ